MTSLQDLWTLVMQELKQDVPHIALQTWFDDMEVLALNNHTLTLYSPVRFKRETIRQYYSATLQRVLRNLLSEPVDVEFLSDAAYEKFLRRQDGRPHPLRDCGVYTFEQFVVGPSNQMAYAAARAVAEQPSRYRNPLILQGTSGLGKTHLLNAIAGAVRERDPEATIVYIKGDDFTNDLVDAIVHDRDAQFRHKYRHADYFLMDDIQFIAGKRQTQEEFFNTFDCLYEANCQIVLAIDRPLYDLTTLQDRIRNRFEGGLIIEITAPDFQTRCAIVESKAQQRGIDLSREQAVSIARQVTCDIRKLEGVLNQLRAIRSVPGCHLDGDDILAALQPYRPKNGASLTPQELVDKVAHTLHLDPALIAGRSNTRTVTRARQIAMYLLCEVYGHSTTSVGHFFRRDHSTVVYALGRMKERLASDPELQAIIGKLSE